MHRKNIKHMARKQLKNQFPNWKRLPKKTKKEIASKILDEIFSEYDLKQEGKVPLEELLAIETQSSVKRGVKSAFGLYCLYDTVLIISRLLGKEYPNTWYHVMNRGRRSEVDFFIDTDFIH